MADAVVTLGADLSQLRRELAKVPNLSTEMAQKTLIALERTVQKAEKAAKTAAKEVGKATKSATDSTLKLADAAGDGERAFLGLADLLEKIDPKLGAAARTAADLGGGIEGVVKGSGSLLNILGPVGVAVGVVGAAYAALTHELQLADQAIADNRAELEKVIEVHRRVKEAAVLAAVAQGDMGQDQADSFMIAQRASDLFGGRLAELRKRQAELGDELRKVESAATDQAKAYNSADVAARAYMGSVGLGAQGAQQASDQTAVLKDQIAALDVQITNTEQARERYKTALEESAEAARRGSSASRDLAEADAERKKQIDDMIKAYGALIGMSFILDERETERLQRERDAARDAAAERIRLAEEIAAAEIAAAEEAQAAWIGSYQSRLQTTADFASMVGQIAVNLAELQGEENEKAAMRAYEIEKAAAIVQIAINGAVAAMRAYAELGPVAGIAGAALMAAVTATQIAVVASQEPPKFHRGRSPDEIPATLTRSEAVLNPSGVAAAGGREAIEALNRGQGMGSNMTVNLQLRHRAVDAVTVDLLRGDSRTSRELSRHRRRAGV